MATHDRPGGATPNRRAAGPDPSTAAPGAEGPSTAAPGADGRELGTEASGSVGEASGSDGWADVLPGGIGGVLPLTGDDRAAAWSDVLPAVSDNHAGSWADVLPAGGGGAGSSGGSPVVDSSAAVGEQLSGIDADDRAGPTASTGTVAFTGPADSIGTADRWAAVLGDLAGSGVVRPAAAFGGPGDSTVGRDRRGRRAAASSQATSSQATSSQGASDRTGSDRPGSGWAGSDRAGSGRAVSGRAGPVTQSTTPTPRVWLDGDGVGQEGSGDDTGRRRGRSSAGPEARASTGLEDGHRERGARARGRGDVRPAPGDVRPARASREAEDVPDGGDEAGLGGSFGYSGSAAAPRKRQGARRERPTGPSAPVDPREAAREICLRQLAVRPRTRSELAAAMRRRGVEAEVAAEILDRYDEVGIIDDAAFAKAWVTSRHHSKGLSRRALAGELRRKGVAADEVGEALDELDPGTEEATARALVARKLRLDTSSSPEALFRRLAGMLARKGYPPSLAMRVVKESLAERADLAEFADNVDADALAPPDED